MGGIKWNVLFCAYRNKGLSVSLFQLLSTRYPSSVVYLWQQFRMNR